MAEQPMTPSRFLNLKRSHSEDGSTKAMADSNLPEALKKTEDRPSPILKGTEKYQSPGSAPQKGMLGTVLVVSPPIHLGRLLQLDLQLAWKLTPKSILMAEALFPYGPLLIPFFHVAK